MRFKAVSTEAFVAVLKSICRRGAEGAEKNKGELRTNVVVKK